MTILGAILAALLKKAHAFLTEVKALVDEAKAVETAIVFTAKREIGIIERKVKVEVTILRDDLVGKISKL